MDNLIEIQVLIILVTRRRSCADGHR